MANINDQKSPQMAEAPMEKEILGDQNVHEVDDSKTESDAESARKQDGVKRVEAITTVWSRELLIAMFIL